MRATGVINRDAIGVQAGTRGCLSLYGVILRVGVLIGACVKQN